MLKHSLPFYQNSNFRSVYTSCSTLHHLNPGVCVSVVYDECGKRQAAFLVRFLLTSQNRLFITLISVSVSVMS